MLECGPKRMADRQSAPAPSPAGPTFRAYQNACWARLEPLGDALSVLAVAALALRLRVAVAQHALFLAVWLVQTAWRTAALASYLRWREAAAASYRLAMFSPWAFWPGIIALVDRSGASLWGDSEALNALKLAAVVPIASLVAPSCGVAATKPVRLWATLLIQAATVGVALSQRGALCATAALHHPAAERLFGAAYDALRWQLALLPLPVSLAAEHGPAGRCGCVVGYVQLAMAFWGVVLASLVAEASMHAHWQARSAAASAAAAEPAGPSEGEGAPAPTVGGAMHALARRGRQVQLRIYSTALAWLGGHDRTWVVMLPLALATTFDWLCLATAG
eukprot:scaffold22.g6121.t1